MEPHLFEVLSYLHYSEFSSWESHIISSCLGIKACWNAQFQGHNFLHCLSWTFALKSSMILMCLWLQGCFCSSDSITGMFSQLLVPVVLTYLHELHVLCTCKHTSRMAIWIIRQNFLPNVLLWLTWYFKSCGCLLVVPKFFNQSWLGWPFFCFLVPMWDKDCLEL